VALQRAGKDSLTGEGRAQCLPVRWMYVCARIWSSRLSFSAEVNRTRPDRGRRGGKPQCTQDDRRCREFEDTTHGMVRTEVRSVHGDSHLRHVFADGSRGGGGMRYGINSASLRLVHRNNMEREGCGAYLNYRENSRRTFATRPSNVHQRLQRLRCSIRARCSCLVGCGRQFLDCLCF
jgi:hypothetical protein